MMWLMLIACGQAEGEEVAAVMLASGRASVVHDGVSAPADVGVVLTRDDVLHTGPDGTILVHLSNDHVVRIDSDLELAVSDLVMLDAPRATIEPGKQLADLLYPEERAGLGADLTRAEGVAGWHSRLTAADSVSGARRRYGISNDEPDGVKASEEERSEMSDDGGGASSPAPPPPIPDVAPKQERTKPKPTSPGRGTKKTGGNGSSSTPTLNIAPADATPQDSRPVPASASPEPAIETSRDAFSTSTPADLATRFATGPDHQCLVAWAEGVGLELDTLTIEVRVAPDGSVRAVGRRGVRVPSCAREIIEATSFADGQQTFTFDVTLE
ncbi:MAG: hypothetical protein R3F61_09485 [Myxococcota bacterium]